MTRPRVQLRGLGRRKRLPPLNQEDARQAGFSRFRRASPPRHCQPARRGRAVRSSGRYRPPRAGPADIVHFSMAISRRGAYTPKLERQARPERAAFPPAGAPAGGDPPPPRPGFTARHRNAPMIGFACPRCGSAYQVPPTAAGKKMPCRKCGQRLLVPFAAAPEMTIEAVPLLPGRASPLAGRYPPRAPAPPPPPPAAGGGVGKFFEGLGVFLFAGFLGVAVLLLAGFFVWRALHKETPAAPPSGETTASTKPDTAPKATELTPKQIFDKCAPSVAKVATRTGTGSGFVARPGVVVTNSHVVRGDLSSAITVTFPSAPDGTRPLKATLMHEDRTRDLAVLRVATELPPLPIAAKETPKGEKVVVIGSPGTLPGETADNSITDGLLGNRTPLDNL